MLNRSERRKKKIKIAEPVINMKESDIRRIENEAMDKAVNLAIPLMLGLPIMVLRDKYGFGKQRCQAFADYVLELYESFEKGYVTLEDMIDTLKEETGLEIVRGKINGR